MAPGGRFVVWEGKIYSEGGKGRGRARRGVCEGKRGEFGSLGDRR
jgi:hypothetical protein